MVEVNGCPVGPKPGSLSKQITHIRVQNRLNDDLDGKSIQEGIDYILACAAEVEDPKFDEDREYGYGDGDSQYLTVAGWRPMTPLELDLYERALRRDKSVREQSERTQLERIRREHPDWLKEDLR